MSDKIDWTTIKFPFLNVQSDLKYWGPLNEAVTAFIPEEDCCIIGVASTTEDGNSNYAFINANNNSDWFLCGIYYTTSSQSSIINQYVPKGQRIEFRCGGNGNFRGLAAKRLLK